MVTADDFLRRALAVGTGGVAMQSTLEHALLTRESALYLFHTASSSHVLANHIIIVSGTIADITR